MPNSPRPPPTSPPPAPPTPPTLEQLAAYAAKFNQSRPLQYHHLKISFPSLDKVAIELDPVTPEHRGGLGTSAINGGVLSAIFDLAIGCTPALVDPTRRSATVQLSIRFERPVLGDTVRAEAQLDHAGSTTLFASAWILDADGQVCARCQGIAKLSNLPWAD